MTSSLRPVLLLLALILAIGCGPVEEVVLVGDSWAGLSAAHIADHIQDEGCSVAFDASSLQKGGSGLSYWLDREEQIRQRLDLLEGRRTIVWLSLGGLEALSDFDEASMQALLDPLLEIFLDYPKVEVLHISYNDFPGQQFTDKLYRLYSILPTDIPYPFYKFIDLHGKIEPVRFVDILHISEDDYRRRVDYVWDRWLRPRMICPAP